ncbi:competence protein CoiA [Thalassotalea sp. PLHSN55]|uniref:competence protein CoiA n=1 Tax=Thalassotalea sp. PLHSN55 TaxID=3435888 RepID=UPI003F864D13
MRYAIIEGVKTEASPKLKGICSNCGAELVAKCGRVKVWHWAHKNKVECDPWWENETEWHRNWKDFFPVEWQEVSHIDHKTGEKHIADVKNPYGLVIEIQHSPIKFEERLSREEFYGDMIWIVDGKRGPLDESYFNMGRSGPIQKDPLAYQVNWYGRSRLLHNWGESKVKVYIDFGHDHLWRLVFFDPVKKVGAVGPISKAVFIEDCLKGNTISVSKKVD